MDTNSNESLWSAKDLMHYLQCGKTSFFAAKRRGDLPPAITIGRGIQRWSPGTVFEWVRERESIVQIDPIKSNRKNKQKTKRRGRPTKVEKIEGVR